MLLLLCMGHKQIAQGEDFATLRKTRQQIEAQGFEEQIGFIKPGLDLRGHARPHKDGVGQVAREFAQAQGNGDGAAQHSVHAAVGCAKAAQQGGAAFNPHANGHGFEALAAGVG